MNGFVVQMNVVSYLIIIFVIQMEGMKIIGLENGMGIEYSFLW